MAFLVDSSILVRLANRTDPFNAHATRAVTEFHRRGEQLHITPQNLVEFRNAATRPIAVNGLGLSAGEADVKMAEFEENFPLLAETPDVFLAWKSLVGALSVIGKQVHDARLVAVCHAHGMTHLLTFNAAHFRRMAAYGPGIVVVDAATM